MPMSERYTVVLEPAPGKHQAPAARRLARLLKAAWRAYGLRCVACEPEAAEASEVSQTKTGSRNASL